MNVPAEADRAAGAATLSATWLALRQATVRFTAWVRAATAWAAGACVG